MTHILIKNIELLFGNQVVHIGDVFTDVYTAVHDNIDTYMTPDEDGYAHVILKDCIFYSIAMHCTLYFNKGVLDEIDMDIDWQNNKNITRSLGIDRATKLIADKNHTALRKYGFEIFNVDKSSTDYYADELVIMTAIMKGNDNYGIKIRKSRIEDKLKYAESKGYAFATKYLIDNKLKVGYMYKEEPDNQQDSGWRFFTGDEDDNYINNPENIGLYSVRTIAEIDLRIIPFLNQKPPFSYNFRHPE